MKWSMSGMRAGAGCLSALVWAVSAFSGFAKETPVVGLASQMVELPGKNFKLCKYEVTQALWEAVTGENPAGLKEPGRPVENVSWNDGQAFIKKLNALPEVKKTRLVYRLPTEGEWEYACRAGSAGSYCRQADGTEITKATLDRVAWYGDNSGGEAHPVGEKEPNAFGLYDMLGNVAEWTATVENGNCVFRGGCWGNGAYDCTAGDRGGLAADLRRGPFGLRLAAETVEAKAAREEAEAKAARAKVVAAVAVQMIEVPRKKFKLCKYEVTQELWKAVMGENPSYFKGADRPVENVSWDECQAFIKKLNALPEVKKSGLKYRLPTEEEWEFACRAGGRGKYCKLAGGTKMDEKSLERVAWYKDNSGEETHPVGQKEPNAWGLYDMHGNVWEWTSTADGGGRVFRGGSWGSSAADCMVANRLGLYSGNQSYCLGFRLAADGR